MCMLTFLQLFLAVLMYNKIMHVKLQVFKVVNSCSYDLEKLT